MDNIHTMYRQHQMNIRISEAERQVWEEAAKDRDTTVSTLIRRCMNALAAGKLKTIPEVRRPRVQGETR